MSPSSAWHLRQGVEEPEAGEHRFVAAANVHLTADEAVVAEKRGSIRLIEAVVTVLETHCGACRLPYERAVMQPCVVDERLRGGPVGTRKRRPREDEDAEANEP